MMGRLDTDQSARSSRPPAPPLSHSRDERKKVEMAFAQMKRIFKLDRFGLQQILHFKGIFRQIKMPRLTRGLLEPIELVTFVPYHLYIDCRIVSVCFGNGAKQ